MAVRSLKIFHVGSSRLVCDRTAWDRTASDRTASDRVVGAGGVARRRPVVLLFVLVATLVTTGCDSTNVLGGVWRATLPPTGDVIIGSGLGGAGTTAQPPLGVELALGLYGPDVTGLFRFYRSDDFTLPRDAAVPSKECSCTFVHRGRWSNAAKRLDFVLKGCLPGAAATQTVYVRGELTLNAVGALSGSLAVEDPASALYGRKQGWVFEPFDSVSRSDLICEPESDADAGNTANGI